MAFEVSSYSENRRLTSRLLQSYQRPEIIRQFSPTDWDVFIRQVRKSRLLASFYAHFERHQLLDAIPQRPLLHLRSAWQLSLKHAADIAWEIEKLGRALDELAQPLVLLKGAAYLAAKLPNAQGRVFQDTDILVHKDQLEQLEQLLNRHGWYTTELSAYDDQYYRRWSHEIPPMRHLQRKSLLDVHHHIVPPTTAIKLPVEKLWSALQPLDGDRSTNCYILSPTDLILHSAVHLFYDGEFEHGLRDLIDIDQLIRHYLKDQPDLLDQLTRRADELDLVRPWFYTLRYLRTCLAVPYDCSSYETQLPNQPPPILLPLMDQLFMRVLNGHHPSCQVKGVGFSHWCLYVRSHYLRMPLHQLLPHLIRKALTKEHQE